MMLLSWANIAYYQSLMHDIRAAVAAGRFAEFRTRPRNSGSAAMFRINRPPAMEVNAHEDGG